MNNVSHEKGTRNPNKAKLVVQRAATLGLVGLMGAVSAVVLQELVKDPLSNEARDEATAVERMRAGEIPTEVVSNTLVFKDGVKYRKTPNFHSQVKNSPELDNVAGEVESGKCLVVDHGLSYTGEDGDDWVGFTLHEENNTSEHRDASDIADSLVWINVSMLRQQNDEKGQPFMSEIENSGQSTDRFITAHIGVDGSITLTKGGTETDVAAVGRTVPQEAADFILGATDALVVG